MAQGTQHKERSMNNPGMGNSGTNNPSSSASSTGTSFVDTAKEMAGNFGEAAKGAAGTVTEKAGEAASFVGKKVEGATSAVAGSMKSLAGTIRENVPSEGILGGAGSAVAETLESGGRYLEEEGLSGIGEDMTNLIRRNPVPAVLVGIAVGFLIARATRS